MSVRWSNVSGQLVVACCSFFLLIQLRLSRLSWCSIAEVVREEVSQFLRRWPKLSRWSRTSSLVVGDEESQHGDTIEALVRCAAEYRHPVLDAFLEDATIAQKSIANFKVFLSAGSTLSPGDEIQEVIDIAKSSKRTDVRQWAMTYGTFCPRRDRSLVYRLVGRSVHISGTCLLIFAQDIMQNNAPVALKLMHNEEEWLREQDMRKLANGDPLDSTHVLQLLNAVEIEGDAGAMDSRLKGDDSYKYMLTMPQAKSDLNDALSHTRFAGRNRAQVVKILYQIATHLQYLNEQCHRIHGDLKPRNIVQLEVETDTGMELVWILIDMDASCAIGEDAGQKLTSS